MTCLRGGPKCDSAAVFAGELLERGRHALRAALAVGHCAFHALSGLEFSPVSVSIRAFPFRAVSSVGRAVGF